MAKVTTDVQVVANSRAMNPTHQKNVDQNQKASMDVNPNNSCGTLFCELQNENWKDQQRMTQVENLRTSNTLPSTFSCYGNEAKLKPDVSALSQPLSVMTRHNDAVHTRRFTARNFNTDVAQNGVLPSWFPSQTNPHEQVDLNAPLPKRISSETAHIEKEPSQINPRLQGFQQILINKPTCDRTQSQIRSIQPSNAEIKLEGSVITNISRDNSEYAKFVKEPEDPDEVKSNDSGYDTDFSSEDNNWKEAQSTAKKQCKNRLVCTQATNLNWINQLDPWRSPTEKT